MLIAESPDGNYSRRKNAGLMPGRGATRRSGRTWHLDLRHHARWLPDCRQSFHDHSPNSKLGLNTNPVIHSRMDSLFAAEIAFRRLHRDMPEKKLDLL